jgi:hypothetical protein
MPNMEQAARQTPGGRTVNIRRICRGAADTLCRIRTRRVRALTGCAEMRRSSNCAQHDEMS